MSTIKGLASAAVLQHAMTGGTWTLPDIPGVKLDPTLKSLAKYLSQPGTEVPRFFVAASSLSLSQQNHVSWKFLHWILVDPQNGVLKFCKPGSKQAEAVCSVASLITQKLNGKKVTQQEWAAEWAAWAAAAWAAAWAAWAARAEAAEAAWAARAEAAWAARAAVARAVAWAAEAAEAAGAAEAAVEAAWAAAKNSMWLKLIDLLEKRRSEDCVS